MRCSRALLLATAGLTRPAPCIRPLGTQRLVPLRIGRASMHDESQPGQPEQQRLPERVEGRKADNTKKLSVGGETVFLDELGPVIIKEDGRLGHIGNWHEMTEPEQQRTLGFVAKRNKKRRDKLLERQRAEREANG